MASSKSLGLYIKVVRVVFAIYFWLYIKGLNGIALTAKNSQKIVENWAGINWTTLLLQWSLGSNIPLFKSACKRGERVNTKQNGPFASFLCQTAANRTPIQTNCIKFVNFIQNRSISPRTSQTENKSPTWHRVPTRYISHLIGLIDLDY